MELRRGHGGEMHADHGRPHDERRAEVGEHRALLRQMKRDPERSGGGADGNDDRGDEEERVIPDRGRETHRRIAGVVHRGDADADQRAR